MLKFFRKIRKNLLETGKFRTYLFYALGEILLVVVGILIALQINNWNEGKRERKLEDEYLHKIALNIKDDINQYNDIITAQQSYRSGIDSFLQINSVVYQITNIFL